MGYFTWKDCQDRRKSVGYDRPVYVICPDDTIIEEPSYDGYGIFGRHDIYDLVVDWNRPYLKEIFDRKAKDAEGGNGYWGQDLYPIAVAAMESDAKALEVVKTLKGKIPEYIFASETEWKRSIGIAIACEDQDNENLPFPIKMSATRPKKPYKKFKPSWSTQ